MKIIKLKRENILKAIQKQSENLLKDIEEESESLSKCVKKELENFEEELKHVVRINLSPNNIFYELKQEDVVYFLNLLAKEDMLQIKDGQLSCDGHAISMENTYWS